MTQRAAMVPGRTLAVLTSLVLLAHGMLLSGGTVQIRPGTLAGPYLHFSTRMLPAAAGFAALGREPDLPNESAPPSAAPPMAAPRAPAQRDAITEPSAPPAIPPPTPTGPEGSQAVLAAIAVHVPASARVRYKVSAQARGIPVSGQGELSWRNDGSEYEAQMQVSALFMPTRTQRSTGRLTAEGIEPIRFSDRTRSEEAAHFERDKGKIIFSANRPEVALLPGAQDRLTVLLQLGALVAGDPRRYTAGSSITLQTASTRDADLWKFTVEGTEELQLPGGRLQTLRLQRAPRFEFDQKVELWLAPGQDYLPVRLRLTQPNGDSVDQEWISTERG